MNLYDRFYRVKTRGDALTKVAELRPALVDAKLAFWQRANEEAACDPDGALLGLAKIARTIGRSARASGEKTASEDTQLAFAASFACGKVVDDVIAKLAADGDLSPDDAAKLATLNAVAAFDDLEKIAFGIADLMAAVAAHPHLTGMVVGAAVGAGVGALNDPENPARGAAAGASLGTAVGALGGQAVHDIRG